MDPDTKVLNWAEAQIQRKLELFELYPKVKIINKEPMRGIFQPNGLQYLSANVIRRKLHEVAVTDYYQTLIGTEQIPPAKLDEMKWNYEQYRYWSVEAVKTFVAKCYYNFISDPKHSASAVAHGISFEINKLPVLTAQEFEFFISEASLRWETYAKERYKQERGKLSQPFTLKFLAIEAFKQQNFLTMSVKRSHIFKYRIFDHQGQLQMLYEELYCTRNMSIDKAQRKAAMLYKSTYF